jgi:hypothetical protein
MTKANPVKAKTKTPAKAKAKTKAPAKAKPKQGDILLQMRNIHIKGKSDESWIDIEAKCWDLSANPVPVNPHWGWPRWGSAAMDVKSLMVALTLMVWI